MAISDTITAPAVRWPGRATWVLVATALAASLTLATIDMVGIGASPVAEPAFRSVDYALRHPEAVVGSPESSVGLMDDYALRHLQPAADDAGGATARSYADYALAMKGVVDTE
jgi:hypothetical protein